MFTYCGVIVGFLLSIFTFPVVINQRIKERIRNIVDGISILWGNLGIVIGILGLVFWAIRLMFFYSR
jgi:hypothetical protein